MRLTSEWLPKAMAIGIGLWIVVVIIWEFRPVGFME